MSVTRARLEPKPTSDVIYSALSGLFIMAVVAAGEGLIAGGLLGITAGPSGYRAGETWAMAAVYGAVCAMAVGGPTGLISFIVVELLCRHLPDEAVGRSLKGAMRGSAFGVVAGGLLGLLLAELMPGTTEPAQGYILGVIVGFIGGTFFGGIKHALMERGDHEEPARRPGCVVVVA